MNYTSQASAEKNEENSTEEYNIEKLERKTELEGNTDYRELLEKPA